MTVEPLRNSNITNQLTASWNDYKKTMIDNGRPLADPDTKDLDRDGNKTERVTFSEAAAYVLLRAAWMNDQETFNEVWIWTKNNLQRCHLQQTWAYSATEKKWVPQAIPESFRDHLFAWRWVPSLNGESTSGGIIYPNDPTDPVDRSGLNAASDDLEIVAALYFAYLRGWGQGSGEENEYLREAKLILADAWQKYVVQVGDQYYLFAGDQFSWSGEINPSYFRPGYYRHIFALLDPDHPWGKVAESSYEVIIQSGRMTLDDRKGVGLPPNWAALSYTGTLTESKYFPGEASEIFGWDAFRTLWGVAQDCAWFNNQLACRYLTDENIGPIDFLSKSLRQSTRTAFHHDGTPITPNPKVEQTYDLDRGQFFMYGVYVPFFHYAGKSDLANEMLARLEGWQMDKRYFTQNWVPLGFMLASGLPGDLKDKMQADIQQRTATLTPPSPKAPEAFVSMVDTRLGTLEPGLRLKLNLESAMENLSQEQVFETIQTITNAPDHPLYIGCDPLHECYPQFQKINQIDQKYEYRLLAYFADFSMYWNNAITLLSVYSQKAIEGNRQEDIRQALEFCQILRVKIEQQEKVELIAKEGLTPHAHSLATLDLTEAELRAQTKDQDIFFYQKGISSAVQAINRMLNLDPKKACPDYFLIAKALLTIGDLYLRMYETTEKEGKTDEYYLDKASEFYRYVAGISEGVVILLEEENLFLSISPALVREALEFNHDMGYLKAEEIPEAESGIFSYLKSIALVKDISLFTRRRGEKTIYDLLKKLDDCDQAINDLGLSTKKSNNFFTFFATLVKADLLLFLADRIKYYLWPNPNNPNPNLGLSRTLIKLLSDYMMLGDKKVRSLIDELLPRLESSNPPDFPTQLSYQRVRENLFNLTQWVIEKAQSLYLKIPPEFPTLYAQSKIKLTEIGVRNADFMGREFRYLLPLYTDPVLNPDPKTGNTPISDDEFLGIELNYLKALLLISQATVTREVGGMLVQKLVHEENIKQAELLLGKVLGNSVHLSEPYQKYFQILGQLKLLEIMLKSKEYKFSGNELNGLVTKFKEIEGLINSFSPEELREMAFNPASLKAELYFEWANALFANGHSGVKYALLSLENCYLSDSPYDLSGRKNVFMTNFGNRSEVRDRDKELQTIYFGGPQNVR